MCAGRGGSAAGPTARSAAVFVCRGRLRLGGACVYACVCYGRGDAEGEETLLVLHANDRFGCNKSLDVGLGKMI